MAIVNNLACLQCMHHGNMNAIQQASPGNPRNRLAEGPKLLPDALGSEIGIHDVDGLAVTHLHAAAVLENGGLGDGSDPLDDLGDRGAELDLVA